MQENEEQRPPVERTGGRRSVPAVITLARDGVSWEARLKVEGIDKPVWFAVEGDDEEQALANAVEAMRRVTFDLNRAPGRRALAAGPGWIEFEADR